MARTFVRATKSQARLRMAICGPGGSGKTYTSLLIATALAGDGRVAVVDSERGSASKYADIFDFDVLELDSFSPATYVDCIRSAEQAGYRVVVIDSLSHAWAGKDGALEMVDKVSARNEAQNRRANSFTAWREVTPEHNRLVDAMLQSPCHVLATMRVKTEFVMDVDDKGRSVPRKVGLAPIQRDGLEYEFDVIADMTVKNDLAVGKTRCQALHEYVTRKPGRELVEILKGWLTSGAPLPPPKETPAAPAQEPSRPAEIPERKELREAIASWSGTAGDDFKAACSKVLASASIPAPGPGGTLDDASVRAALAWVQANRDRPFTEAVAVERERRAWDKPAKVSKFTVWYWRRQLVEMAEAWIKEHPIEAGQCTGEKLVRNFEASVGLPEPGQMEERRASALYAAATEKEIAWLDLCIPF